MDGCILLESRRILPRPGHTGNGSSRQGHEILRQREDGTVTRVVLTRHAEPLIGGDTPAAEWPLTDKGRNDARVLGRRLASRSASKIVWASPERRARETALLAFPSVAIDVRDQLMEVKKPWYASSAEHADAVARYLRREVVVGWEPRQDVIARIAQLKSDFGSPQNMIIVSHGVFLTTWIDLEVGLEDPVSFWSNLRMPDAWELDLEEMSLEPIS